MDTIIIDGLSFALPLFIMAIGGIYSERSGVTMLAVEGLQGFGAFTGAAVVVLLAKPLGGISNPAMIYIAMITAMAGGLIFSLIHAVLCIKFRAQQVISGVLVNILAVAMTTFWTSIINLSLTGEASNKFQIGVSTRFSVPLLSKIPVLGAVFTNVYPFEAVIVVIALIAWYLLCKTGFGLRLRSCGENPKSLDTAGGNVTRIRFTAVMICGALCGLGGIFMAYSISANFSPGIYMGYGYLSIAALIFGNWKIIPTLGACLFFGISKSAGYQICLKLGMPSNYSDLVLVLPYVFTLLLLIFFSQHNHSPRALGEFFDKEKR
ncbi:MAG: ABC transporter permease [Spirochaetaceae bacterium]|jgi:simple sugar transport system permease protein|nr:ABC transporter permease [Spirochaetaceae bacterium]